MRFDPREIRETIDMIGSEHFDIRTVTLGVSLLDAPSKEIDALCRHIERKLTDRARSLVSVAKDAEERYGVPITNKRISVTPISLITEGLPLEAYVRVAETLDRTAGSLGIDYIAGFSALTQKGATPGDLRLIQSLPQVMRATRRVCASINLASSRTGINMDVVALMGHVIKDVADATRDQGGIGCAKLVVFSNVPEDNPFVAGAQHGVGEPDTVINVGVSGPGVVLSAIQRLRRMNPRASIVEVAETIKRMSFKITRAGELIGREVADRLGGGTVFGVVDLSLAPTPAIGDSVADIIEAMGIERIGAHGSTAALAMLVDAVKKGGAMASSSIGGLSGAFIPVSEDAGMVRAVKEGALSLDKLEAMTAVCSVGLDMVAIPGDTPPETIAAIIADEMAIGVINHKTTAVRIIPVPGKGVGETWDYGGLLGELVVMPVSIYSSAGFINLGGRMPAPITSLRN